MTKLKQLEKRFNKGREMYEESRMEVISMKEKLAIALEALNQVRSDCQKEHCHCGCFEVENAFQLINSLTLSDDE
jgi:hypothetical protein